MIDLIKILLMFACNLTAYFMLGRKKFIGLSALLLAFGISLL